MISGSVNSTWILPVNAFFMSSPRACASKRWSIDDRMKEHLSSKENAHSCYKSLSRITCPSFHILLFNKTQSSLIPRILSALMIRLLHSFSSITSPVPISEGSGNSDVVVEAGGSRDALSESEGDVATIEFDSFPE